MLPNPKGGIYGLDVNPFNIRAHLAYSLKRLGLDYIDLYQPARIDTAIPIEDIMLEMKSLVDEGLIKNIGLSMVDAETLKRACKIYPVHTLEIEYSLLNRNPENGLIKTAEELGVNVVTFGAVGHGILSNKSLNGNDIYFATYTSSRKVRHYRANPKACVYFIEKGRDFQGLEIKENMQVLCDQDLKNKFWRPFFFRFYKHGPTDPGYCILKFTGFEAIYFAHQSTKTIKL